MSIQNAGGNSGCKNEPILTSVRLSKKIHLNGQCRVRVLESYNRIH